MKGFKQLSVVMAISVALIFLALVFQFRNAVKPLIVFAAIPYGVAGALVGPRHHGPAVRLHGVPRHRQPHRRHRQPRHRALRLHRGGARAREPLREALLDAGIVRLRPVLITVGATVFGLFPLAMHGGPLWEPLCYAQIGGLTLATFVTLLLVPVIYSIFVLDLKLIRWEKEEDKGAAVDRAEVASGTAAAELIRSSYRELKSIDSLS